MAATSSPVRASSPILQTQATSEELEKASIDAARSILKASDEFNTASSELVQAVWQRSAASPEISEAGYQAAVDQFTAIFDTIMHSVDPNPTGQKIVHFMKGAILDFSVRSMFDSMTKNRELYLQGKPIEHREEFHRHLYRQNMMSFSYINAVYKTEMHRIAQLPVRQIKKQYSDIFSRLREILPGNTNAAILIDLLAAISRQHSHFGDEKIWKFRQFIYSSERERQVLHILNQTEGYSLDTAVDYIMDLLLSPAEERDQIVDYLNGLIQNEVKENIPSQANG